MEVEPHISVVVSVFNGKRDVERCLESLFQVNYRNYEIILINDGSTDGTDKVVKRYENRTIYVKNEINLGLAASRNRGIRLARGEYVAFTDVDCVVDKYWLTELVQCLIKNKAEGAGGAVKTPKDISFFARCVGTLGKPSPKLISKNEAEVPGCNAIFKKSLLKRMGGFDETFKESNADTDFNIRVWTDGRKIYYQPTAIIYHYHRSSLFSFIKWRFTNGIGLYRLARKHRFRAKTLYHIFNLVLLPFLFFIGFLGLLIGPIIWVFLLLVLYIIQLSKLCVKKRDEFRFSEICCGIFLNWLLRFSASVGFWYAMITLSRNRKES